jgi:hypothetical protein
MNIKRYIRLIDEKSEAEVSLFAVALIVMKIPPP